MKSVPRRQEGNGILGQQVRVLALKGLLGTSSPDKWRWSVGVRAMRGRVQARNSGLLGKINPEACKCKPHALQLTGRVAARQVALQMHNLNHGR